MRRWALLLGWAAATAGCALACDQSPLKSLDSGDGGDGGDATAGEAGGDGEAGPGCGFDASSLDPAAVMAGLQLVGTRKCEDCHGSTLSGNNDGVPSPQTQGGLAYPPNLTGDPTHGLGCWTDQQIVTAILEGVDDQGMALCPPMPRFGHRTDGGLDAMQALEIVQYLRSLPVSRNQVPDTPPCPAPEAGPDAEADVMAEAGMDAGVDSSADGAPETGPEGGRDSGVDAASDAPADGTIDGGADAARESSTDASPESSAETDAGDGGVLEGGD